MFDSKLGLILRFDLDLGLISTKVLMQQGPGEPKNMAALTL